MPGDFLFTSESVTEGHPDKVCDQISDAVLDAVLEQDATGRVACETFIATGLVIVGGEITTDAYVEIPNLVRDLIAQIGYTRPEFGFDAQACAILNAIGPQSKDIAQGVDTGGAGDQGSMVGYATNETPELMPMPISFAHKLCRRLAQVRKENILSYLGPDGKTQVTVEYRDGKPHRIDAIVISCQHTTAILDKTGNQITQESREEIVKAVVGPIVPKDMLDERTKYFINPTGKFVIGGPRSDTGMTGRKLIVDTYGGMAAHGGGAFSGKDPTKVDRSASYMARYIAKNVVASGLAEKCTVQLAYAIGVAEPVSVMIWCDRTEQVPEERIRELVTKLFPLTPHGIIEVLDLRKCKYVKTAAYGHFGREEDGFPWERTDIATDLKRLA